MNPIAQFLSGGVMLGCVAIGFIFFQSWRKSKDSFHAAFALAFWILAVERIILLGIGSSREWDPFIYLVRFGAFLVILAAILLKNLPGRGGNSS